MVPVLIGVEHSLYSFESETDIFIPGRFVTMESEEIAVQTLLVLRNKTFNGAPIKARLKSENARRAFFPTAVVAKTEKPAAVPSAVASVLVGGTAYEGIGVRCGGWGRKFGVGNWC